jgi:hypothetical protein
MARAPVDYNLHSLLSVFPFYLSLGESYIALDRVPVRASRSAHKVLQCTGPRASACHSGKRNARENIVLQRGYIVGERNDAKLGASHIFPL